MENLGLAFYFILRHGRSQLLAHTVFSTYILLLCLKMKYIAKPRFCISYLYRQLLKVLYL